MELCDDVQNVLDKLANQHWPPELHYADPPQQLIVRGLYRYEHAGFGGAFSPGRIVSFEREPGNQYDPNAIRVILSDGKMLGYIAKEMVATMAYEMDHGMKFIVWIASDSFQEDKWGQCKLDILLKISEKDLATLETISSFDRNSVRRYRLGVDVAQVYWSKSPLVDAVRLNDVVKAHDLISQGHNVDVMTVILCGHAGHALRFYTSPLLMMVQSVEMYKLFVEAGCRLHPRSYLCAACRIFGKEHNLLDKLWRGPKMDEASLELADYLVFTGYDMSLRGKIDDIRKCCERTDGGCPYENNKEYVLEWCDMEKRAIAAAYAYVNEIVRREGLSHHSLGWDLGLFVDEWKESGYDQSLQWHLGEFSKEDTPPRYVYPERILKRKFCAG